MPVEARLYFVFPLTSIILNNLCSLYLINLILNFSHIRRKNYGQYYRYNYRYSREYNAHSRIYALGVDAFRDDGKDKAYKKPEATG